VVLACGEGLDNRAVAKKLRCSLGMVGKWRARFLKERLEGLYDEQRPGAPRKVSDEQIEQVVIQALESTPRGQTHWSTREMAKIRTQPYGHQSNLARIRLTAAS
jgi:transposase